MITMRRRLANFLKSNPQKVEKSPEVPAILLPPVEPIETNNKKCQKCGKEFQRGLFMHEKHCKGV